MTSFLLLSLVLGSLALAWSACSFPQLPPTLWVELLELGMHQRDELGAKVPGRWTLWVPFEAMVTEADREILKAVLGQSMVVATTGSSFVLAKAQLERSNPWTRAAAGATLYPIASVPAPMRLGRGRGPRGSSS